MFSQSQFMYPHYGSNFLHNTSRSVQQPIELDLGNIFGQALPVSQDVQDHSIVLDEEDTFKCGKCKSNFSFSEFVLHKKTNCQSGVSGLVLNEEQSYEAVEEKKSDVESYVSPIVLDSGNLITLMQSNENESPNICQEFSTGEIESSISVEVKQYNVVHELPNIEVNSLLNDNFILNNNKLEPCSRDDSDVLLKGVSENICFEESNTPKGKNKSGIHEENLKFKCSFCTKSFRKNYSLQQHLRIHTGERPFLCVICGKAFNQKSNVIKHMETHKVWPKKVCSLPKFLVHVNSNKPTLTTYQEAGDKMFIAFDKSFFCQYCPSAFNSYPDWRFHMKSHVNVKVYKCIQSGCDLTFPDLDAFLEHSKTHCGMANYSCHVCQQDFQSLDELGHHHYTHAFQSKKPAKSATCSKCQERFVSEAELTGHKCNNYPCPLCNRIFSCVRFLRRHLALHNAEPIYSCPDCNKTFKTTKYLSSHRLVHSNEKPYNCQVCTAAFNRRDKLLRHNLTHTQDKKFKCPFSSTDGCTKEFSRKDKLKQHVKIMHNHDKNAQLPVSKGPGDVLRGGSLPQIEIVVLPISANDRQSCVESCTPREILSG